VAKKPAARKGAAKKPSAGVLAKIKQVVGDIRAAAAKRRAAGKKSPAKHAKRARAAAPAPAPAAAAPAAPTEHGFKETVVEKVQQAVQSVKDAFGGGSNGEGNATPN